MIAPVLVTGAGGCIGRHVCALLERERLAYVGTVRPGAPEAGKTHGLGGFVALDAADASAARHLVEELRPRAILNLAGAGLVPAARADRDLLQAVNVELPCALWGALPDGAVLVQAGTVAEYVGGEALDEERSERAGRTPYAASKCEADRRLDELAKADPRARRALRARISWTVGEGERPERLLPSLVAAAKSRTPIELTDGTQLRDLLHASDVADALLALARSALPSQGVNVGRGQGVAVRDVVLHVAGRLGATDLLRFGVLPQREGEGHALVPDVRRLLSTGFAPRLSLEASLDRAIDELAGHAAAPAAGLARAGGAR